jgi:hypothetical protein
MRMEVKVAIDCMGGDHGAHVTVPAALAVARDDRDASFILVGLQDTIASELKRHGAAPDTRMSIRHASQVVEMNEAPAAAMRAKKDSSMRVAVNLVEQGEAAACVSAGNTGALMAISRFVLGMLPGMASAIAGGGTRRVHFALVVSRVMIDGDCLLDNDVLVECARECLGLALEELHPVQEHLLAACEDGLVDLEVIVGDDGLARGVRVAPATPVIY